MVVYTIILAVISSLVGTIDANLGGGGEGVRPAGVSFLFNILVAPPLWAGLYVGAFKGLNSQSLELFRLRLKDDTLKHSRTFYWRPRSLLSR